EMSDVLHQIHWLRKEAGSKAPEATHDPLVLSGYLQHSKPSCYPHFEIAFWTNQQGKQRVKFDVRPVSTPAIDVSPFPFFRKIFFDENWVVNASAAAKDPKTDCPSEGEKPNFNGVYLQSVLSPSTD